MCKIIGVLVLAVMLSGCANVNFNDQPVYKSEIK